MSQKINWYRSNIPNKTMKDLTKRSDFKGLTQVGLHIALAILLGVASYWYMKQELWLLGIITYLIYAMVFSFLGITAAIHELSHKTVFLKQLDQ